MATPILMKQKADSALLQPFGLKKKVETPVRKTEPTPAPVSRTLPPLPKIQPQSPPKSNKAMVFEVGAGLTPEEKSRADMVLKKYTTPEPKKPFMIKKAPKDAMVFEVGKNLTPTQKKRAEEVIGFHVEKQLAQPTKVEAMRNKVIAPDSPLAKGLDFMFPKLTREEKIAMAEDPINNPAFQKMVREGAIGAVGSMENVSAKVIRQIEKSLGKKLLASEKQQVMETLQSFRKQGMALVDATPEGPVFQRMAKETDVKAPKPVASRPFEIPPKVIPENKPAIVDSQLPELPKLKINTAKIPPQTLPVSNAADFETPITQQVDVKANTPAVVENIAKKPDEIKSLVDGISSLSSEDIERLPEIKKAEINSQVDNYESYQKQVLDSVRKDLEESGAYDFEGELQNQYQNFVNLVKNKQLNFKKEAIQSGDVESLITATKNIVPENQFRKMFYSQELADNEVLELFRGRLMKEDPALLVGERTAKNMGFEGRIKNIKSNQERIARLEKISQIKRVRDDFEIGRRAMKEVRTESGVKNIKSATPEQLDLMKGKVEERASFKKEHGLRIVDEDFPVNHLTDEEYLDNVKNLNSIFDKQKLSTMASEIKKGASRLFAPISTRLKHINPELKTALRRTEYNVASNTQSDLGKVESFLNKMNKEFSSDDYAVFDLAAKNGDASKVAELAKRYHIESELSQVRSVFDDLYKRAKDVDYDFGYRADYFPRVVKNSQALMEYLEKSDSWGDIQEAIMSIEMQAGRYLTVEEKAQVVNSLIRGYSFDGISLAKTAQMKKRIIDVIDSNINQFYEDLPVGIVKYIQGVNEAIEARKFFGKGSADVKNSIGGYIIKLISEGKIKPSQEKELKEILEARFSPKGPGSAIRLYKNISYIDTMGSPISAITQLGDLGLSLYRAGFFTTVKSVARAFVNKSNITVKDIGIDKIAQEFADGSTSGKAVSEVFKIVGLDKMDRLGKETFVNSVIENYQKLAHNPTTDFLARLKAVFGDETPKIIEELKSGMITENVKLLAFNELLDIQPVALSEMPEQYLKGGNGRIFYMLKTFQLKQFDIYRNEIIEKMKTDPVEGIKRMIKLLSALVLMNATADEIKDFILGRETSLEDRTVDNILKLVGFNKYTIYKIREEGPLKGLSTLVLPPFKFIDSVFKDAATFGDGKGFETASSVPVGGKLYYWWFGRGARKVEEKQKKSEAILSPGLPKLPKLPSLPTLPKLPSLP